MAVTYLIDDLLSFSPDDKLLKNIKMNKNANLHAPASQCLLALIERQGEVISQEELYNIGWGEMKGPVTSPSAYYQCFVNLRKQLKAINYEDELVITVPKEGMKLNPTAKVVAMPVVTKVQAVSTLSAKARHLGITCWLKTNRMFTTLVVMACVALVVLASVSFHQKVYVNERFSNVRGLPECVFLRKTDNVSLQDAIDSIRSHKITCSSDRPVYVSVSFGRVTSIACDRELKKCRSVTEISHHG
ncbi:transcriptional regulator [Enterobacteriaceae bacterium C34A]